MELAGSLGAGHRGLESLHSTRRVNMPQRVYPISALAMGMAYAYGEMLMRRDNHVAH